MKKEIVFFTKMKIVRNFGKVDIAKTDISKLRVFENEASIFISFTKYFETQKSF